MGLEDLKRMKDSVSKKKEEDHNETTVKMAENYSEMKMLVNFGKKKQNAKNKGQCYNVIKLSPERENYVLRRLNAP